MKIFVKYLFFLAVIVSNTSVFSTEYESTKDIPNRVSVAWELTSYQAQLPPPFNQITLHLKRTERKVIALEFIYGLKKISVPLREIGAFDYVGEPSISYKKNDLIKPNKLSKVYVSMEFGKPERFFWQEEDCNEAECFDFLKNILEISINAEGEFNIKVTDIEQIKSLLKD